MELFVISLVSIVSGVLQSVVGFGSGIVLMLFFPYIMGMLEAVTMSGIIGTAATIALSWKFRKYINYKLSFAFSLAYISTSTLVIYNISKFNLSSLTAAFGIFLIALSLFYLLNPNMPKPSASLVHAIIFGAIGGIAMGLFGIGGPFLALFFAPISKTRNDYMGNMQFCATTTAIVATTERIIEGMFSKNLITAMFAGVICILLGKRLGLKIRIEDKEKLLKIVYCFIGLNGLYVLISNL